MSRDVWIPSDGNAARAAASDAPGTAFRNTSTPRSRSRRSQHNAIVSRSGTPSSNRNVPRSVSTTSGIPTARRASSELPPEDRAGMTPPSPAGARERDAMVRDVCRGSPEEQAGQLAAAASSLKIRAPHSIRQGCLPGPGAGRRGYRTERTMCMSRCYGPGRRCTDGAAAGNGGGTRMRVPPALNARSRSGTPAVARTAGPPRARV